ncbi:MAG: hypothetical protein QM724_07085 [Flavobacteriales bacterium]
MRSAFLLLLSLATLAIIPGGCKKDDTPARIDLGYGYFPTDIGRWIEYDVDSNYQDAQTIRGDTVHHTHHRLREELTNAFTDGEGRAAQRVVRYRQDSTGTWLASNVWWQTRTSTQAERSEDNQRRVKLVFPPRTGQYWNTNATNTDPAFELTYVEVDAPWSVNGMRFDSTLLVKTTYPNNLVLTRTYYERYAKHVGLVYRQMDSTSTQSGNVRGTWYRQVITGYSH